MGLLEYLEMAEQLHAQPVLAVWTGYTLTGTVVPQAKLRPTCRRRSTRSSTRSGRRAPEWGAQRAADGHPAPFDSAHGGGRQRGLLRQARAVTTPTAIPMFHDAIKAAYPQLKIVATTPVTSRPVDVLDEHYYNNDPSYFASARTLFDGASRSGPKVLVGEYATTAGHAHGHARRRARRGRVPDRARAQRRPGDRRLLRAAVRQRQRPELADEPHRLRRAAQLRVAVLLRATDARRRLRRPRHRLPAGGGHRHPVRRGQSQPGHTYIDVVNNGTTAAMTNVTIAGVNGATGGPPASCGEGRVPRTRLAGPRGSHR